MTKQSQGKFLLMVGLSVIVAVIGYYLLTMPDQRNGVQKLGDAIEQLHNGNGSDKAARELKDRTPGERIGDAVKDAGDKFKGTDNQ